MQTRKAARPAAIFGVFDTPLAVLKIRRGENWKVISNG